MITRRGFMKAGAAAGLVLTASGKLPNFSDDVAYAMQPNDKAIISLTFDDALISFYKVVFPLLKTYKMPATSYIPTKYILEKNPAYCSDSQLFEMYMSGLVEPGNHSRNHLHWASLTDAEILAEIINAQADLAKFGLVGSGAFTAPFGDPYDYNEYPGLYERMVPLLQLTGFVTSSRVPWDDTDIFNIVEDFNQWKINSYQLIKSRTVSQIKSLINEAVAEKKLLVLTAHNVLVTPIEESDFSKSALNSILNYTASLRSQGLVDVVNITQATGKMLRFLNLP